MSPVGGKNRILSGKKLCFVTSVFCSVVKDAFKDRCILPQSILKM